jgi:lipoprotein NlpI
VSDGINLRRSLGVALLKENQLDDAYRQFQQTLLLDPTNRFASDYLIRVQSLKQRAP